jgi:hypothetical protein
VNRRFQPATQSEQDDELGSLGHNMSADLDSECRDVITQHLESITVQLVAALRVVVGSNASSDIATLRFEFESPHFDEGFPVTFWFEHKSGGHSVVQKLLPDLEHTIPEAVIYDQKFEAAGLDTWAIASELFVPWFADCWRDAGGSNFYCPAYLAHHDSTYSFDLTRRIDVTPTR